jgi:hypothetical protein
LPIDDTQDNCEPYPGVHPSDVEKLQGPAPRGYNGETISGGWMELVCQLLPSPISTRLYDTYPETVKVATNRKDNGDGQTQGRSNPEQSPLAPSCAEAQDQRFVSTQIAPSGRAKRRWTKENWRRCPEF